MTAHPAREPRWVVRLAGADLPGAPAPGLLGGKGASLDRLIGWGMPIPPTAVVLASATTAMVADGVAARVVDRIRAGEDVAADEVDAAFLASEFPTGFSEQLHDVVESLAIAPHGSLAVRSSATVEDLAASSFAGQYRSLLGVPADDVAQLGRAIRLVAASLWHPAPCAYRRALGVGDEGAAMAVVLMAMVDAVQAGVIFTRDPTGDPTVARIEWIAGMADDLVSGRKTPAAVLVRRDGTVKDGPALGEEQTRMWDAVLHVALEIEERAGCPQDIEWAWDGERVWLVQARPITVERASLADPFDDPTETLEGLDLTTAGIGEMLPGVLSPLLWDINSYLVEEAFRTVLAGLGVLPLDLVDRRGIVRRVRGRAAMDFDRIAAMATELPGSSVAAIEEQYFGSRRAGRPIAAPADRVFSRRRHLSHDIKVASLRRRSRLSADVCIQAVRGVVDDETAGREPGNPSEIIRQHISLLDLAGRLVTAELAVAADAAASFRRLELSLARWFDAGRCGTLATELTMATSLSSLTPPSASAAVFAGPTWSELNSTQSDQTKQPPFRVPDAPRPSDRIGADELASAERADALLREALSSSERFHSTGWSDHLRFRSARLMAQDASAQLQRREHAKAALLTLGGVIRRLHLAAGEYLVRAGVLPLPTEVELLTVAELHAALTTGNAPPPSTRARRRHQLRSHETLGPLPMRFSGCPEPVSVTVPLRGRLEGWATSPGSFSGFARVVSSPQDTFYDDEVLVAVSTDPSWSALFARAGAIVLERGGPLSHGAILARELGVPAVLNVPDAVALLAGRHVVVDGDAGVVAVLDAGAAASMDALSPPLAAALADDESSLR